MNIYMKPQRIMKQFALNIIDKTIITKNFFFKISIKLGGSACSGTRIVIMLSQFLTVNMLANSGIILYY